MINKKQIIPAILSADSLMVINQAKLFDGLTEVVQLDVIDGQFVNNITCRPDVLKDVLTKTKVEVHLMVAQPESWLNDCVALKACRVYLHVETIDSSTIISNFKQNNIDVFLALNPETPIEIFSQYKNLVDGCLILGVNPGKQGQSFIPQIIDKIINFKADYPEKLLAVDGGINQDNLKIIANVGADYLICGSSIFSSPDPVKAFNELNQLL